MRVSLQPNSHKEVTVFRIWFLNVAALALIETTRKKCFPYPLPSCFWCTDLLLWDGMKLWMHVFPTAATHPPVLPRLPFQAAPLCVFSFCFSATFQTAASSLLPFHLSAPSTVAFSVCVPRRERKKKKKISEPYKCGRKFLTESSAPLPDGRLEMKSCWNGDGISFAYLFFYGTEVLVNKCVSCEGKTFNERGFQWVQPHPEPSKKSLEPCFFIVLP